MKYDVIIAGGGPAGATTAFYLAKQDVRVLLLDKAVFPREKVCGDGIAPRAVRSLYRMGLQERLDGHFNKFHGFRFAGAGKSMVENRIPATPRFPDHGYIIRRYELDKIILDHARDNGVEVWENCKVTAPLVHNGRVVGVKAIRDGKETVLESSVVVGADGHSSPLGKAMGLLVDNPLYLGICVRQYFEGVEDIGDYLEIYPESGVNPGSGWVFPLTRDGVANVGVGVMLYHAQRHKISLHRYYDTLLHHSYHVAPKMKNARPISPLRGAILRLGLGGSKVECPGMILVGDAASMTNPVSGEGITYALETGEMAAEHILDSRMSGKGFHIDPAEDSFREKLEKRYRSYFRLGTLSVKWANKNALMRPMLAAVSRRERWREHMIRVLMHLKH
ncbi:MAG TPA: geranylgeranyl reductase family protein [Geobacteraceae bacterium]|nr:geranylgeranyl reductase family protein [Geobacteraceae bacterium]